MNLTTFILIYSITTTTLITFGVVWFVRRYNNRNGCENCTFNDKALAEKMFYKDYCTLMDCSAGSGCSYKRKLKEREL